MTRDDDATSVGTVGTYTLDGSAVGAPNPVLKRLFASCNDDPHGSVHRAWAVTVLFMILFVIIACVEAISIKHDEEASLALEIAAYFTGLLHLVIAIVGTFVLKRFSTSFTIGCFLGVSVVVSQQNLLLFAAFHRYRHGDTHSNSIFADLALTLCFLLTFFSLILYHFRDHIIEAK